ncbi:hypothetical protein LOTGIDRAFT_235024 [Lottia gigantea]|uniref:ceramide glucosyltransferase n=1 Tax=Lottia gigantea TaxID=225164 RepID=V3ZY22_LOTGI|nr:hypothetical protein LOTGIDRAFT_235024 [Lottia gigantea]ESO87535.1 hypothetical protein LOTGIDRAFT_235024 [Lottia gigantea]
MIYFEPQTWSNITLIFGILALVLYCLSTFMIFLSLVYAKCKLHKKSAFRPNILYNGNPNGNQGVSVIKPLLGTDPLLRINLESHFQLDYPKFELLFCFHDENDPAVTLVNELRECYPHVSTRLFFGGCDGIVNPMVNNILPAYNAASYGYIWISTSRIMASTEILLDMVEKLADPKVGLVHQLPFVTDQPGLAGMLEKVYFGCVVSRYYLSINALGLLCATGMSYTFRKSIVDEINGLEYFGQYLAEDFFLTSKVFQAGYHLIVSAYPAQQNVANPTISKFSDRIIRWLRLRLTMMTFTTLLIEPAVECLVLGAYSAFFLHYYFGFNPYLFFIGHVTLWIIRDYIQLSIVQNAKLPFSKLTFVLVWFLREFLQIVMLMKAIMQPRTIKWGNRTYLVHFGGVTEIKREKSSMTT